MGSWQHGLEIEGHAAARRLAEALDDRQPLRLTRRAWAWLQRAWTAGVPKRSEEMPVPPGSSARGRWAQGPASIGSPRPSARAHRRSGLHPSCLHGLPYAEPTDAPPRAQVA